MKATPITTASMRRLDTLAGLPLATLLGLWPRRETSPPPRPSTIVVVKLFGLGSILLAASALRELRERLPGARIYLVTFDSNRELGDLSREIEAVYPIRAGHPCSLIRDGLRVLRLLRRQRPDLVLDLEYFSKLSTAFARMLGGRHLRGFLLPRAWRRRLLDSGITYREDIHFVDCVARLLHPWGVEHGGDHTSITLEVPAPAREAAAMLLASLAGPDRPWVLINPHAHDLCLERRWPAERFARVVEGLADRRPEFHFALLGNRAEAPHAEALLMDIRPALRGRVHLLAGRTTLAELAAILQTACLLLTNDSGVMHLGAAAGTPLVALFGPESPTRYRPLAPAARCRVLQGLVVCGPCLSFMNDKTAPCHGENRCMAAIEVETVLAACLELYSGPRF